MGPEMWDVEQRFGELENHLRPGCPQGSPPRSEDPSNGAAMPPGGVGGRLPGAPGLGDFTGPWPSVTMAPAIFPFHSLNTMPVRFAIKASRAEDA
jgi:hypothetical protein